MNRDIIPFKRDQRVISLKYLIRLRLVLWAAVIKTKGKEAVWPPSMRPGAEEEEEAAAGDGRFRCSAADVAASAVIVL